MNTLYLIATPIGNLADISLRAADVITNVNILLCEDTRRTGKLIQFINENTQFKGHPKLTRFDDKTENKSLSRFINLVKYNKSVGVVSDSGTPLISDPGYKLVREIYEKEINVNVESVPGPSAVITGLTLSGFEPDKFLYLGYLPRKKGDLKKLFDRCRQIHSLIPTTFIAFESPYRLKTALTVMQESYKDNVKVFIGNEMTKLFEKKFMGTPNTLLKLGETFKGETTVVFRLIDIF